MWTGPTCGFNAAITTSSVWWRLVPIPLRSSWIGDCVEGSFAFPTWELLRVAFADRLWALERLADWGLQV